MADENDLRDTLKGKKDLASYDLRSANLSEHDFTGCNLYNTRLEKANLSRANFSGCDLTKAKFEHTNLTEANCQESKFAGSIFGVNFSKTDLRNSIFSTPSLFNRCNFDKADLRGANFANTLFKDGNSFTDVIYDKETEFEGVEILRPQSKAPAFEYFTHSRGKLHRSASIEVGPDLSTAESEPNHQAPQSGQTIAATIGMRLAEDPIGSAVESANFTELFATQIGWWESKKPNQNDESWETHHKFLKETHSEFSNLTKLIEQLKTDSTSENQQRTGEQAKSILQRLNKWLSDYGTTIAKGGNSAALISMVGGATYSLIALTGADPNLVLAITTATIGGPTIAKTVGFLLNKKDIPSEE